MHMSSTHGTPPLLTLPAEMLTKVISYLPTPLARCSTICRELQPYIEAITFKLIRLKLTELSTFKNTFNVARAHRRQALCAIFLTDVVRDKGVYEDAACWGEILNALLSELNQWELDHEKTDGRKLASKIEFYLEHTLMSHFSLNPNESYKLIPIKDVEDTPAAGSVRILNYEPEDGGHRLDPVGLVELATKFSNLDVLTLGVFGRFLTMRTKLNSLFQKRRIDLSTNLLKLPSLTPRLTTLHLNFFDEEPWNHGFLPLSLIPPNETADPLSTALHIVSTCCVNLRSLKLTGRVVIGPELFWPQGASICGQGPVWQNLEKFTLEISVVAPDGQWYIMSPPGKTPKQKPLKLDSDNGDMDNEKLEVKERQLMGKQSSFRKNFNPDNFNPLIRALTQSVQHMPKLKRLDLEMNHDNPEAIANFIVLTPGSQGGMSHHQEQDGADCRRWYAYLGWKAGAKWDIPDDIREGWDRWVGDNGVVRVEKIGN